MYRLPLKGCVVMQLEPPTETALEKLSKLRERLVALSPLAVAFSGGVDSSLLCAVASEVLGQNVLALTCKTPFLTGFERELIEDFVDRFDIPWHGEHIDPLADAALRKNPEDRCYRCKHQLFSRLLELARDNGFEHLADGSSSSDDKLHRPGRRAIEELGVLSPLKDVGLGKADIRSLARHVYDLPQADMPAQSCLASRIPYGEELRPDRLERVERLEDWLRRRGFSLFRVRDHGDIARLELAREEMGAFFDRTLMDEFTEGARALGFRFVTLDLEGYRSGCYDKA
jgi:uncharacterized protein